jgi:hypothetical protein
MVSQATPLALGIGCATEEPRNRRAIDHQVSGHRRVVTMNCTLFCGHPKVTLATTLPIVTEPRSGNA